MCLCLPVVLVQELGYRSNICVCSRLVMSFPGGDAALQYCQITFQMKRLFRRAAVSLERSCKDKFIFLLLWIHGRYVVREESLLC